MTYVSLYRSPTPDIPVPITNRFVGGDGTAIPFNAVISDSAGHWGGISHPDVVCKGGSAGFLCKGVLSLRMEDFTSGTEFQLWQIEYDTSDWSIVEVNYAEEEYAPNEHDLLPRGDEDHDVSVKHYRFPVFSYVNPGHALGFRITQFHDSATYVDEDGITRDFRIGVITKAKVELEINPK